MSRPSRRSTPATPRERPAPQATASVFTARCRRMPTSTVSRSNTAVSSRIRTWITRARMRPLEAGRRADRRLCRLCGRGFLHRRHGAIRSSACSASAPRSSTAAAAFQSLYSLYLLHAAVPPERQRDFRILRHRAGGHENGRRRGSRQRVPL